MLMLFLSSEVAGVIQQDVLPFIQVEYVGEQKDLLSRGDTNINGVFLRF